MPLTLRCGNNPAVLVRCFQCGKATPASEAVAVGDGRFCPDCFATLLDATATSDKRSDATQGPTRQTAVSPLPAGHEAKPQRQDKNLAPAAPTAQQRASSRHSRCLVCEVPLVAADAVAFLGGVLCAVCCEQMNAELAEARSREAPEKRAQPATMRQERDSGVDDAGTAPKAGVAVWTPGSETVACAGCQRPMPGPGSYRILGGAPYCAACLPFYARLEQEAGALVRKGSTPIAAAERLGANSSEQGCDCCGRQLQANAEPHQGFYLCAACQADDVELALLVAKARHRRHLIKLKQRLEEGADGDR